LANFNINTAGFVIVGIFVVNVGRAALSIWRFGHVEERWDAAALRARAGVGAAQDDPLADRVWSTAE
jgi:hypothetical protein